MADDEVPESLAGGGSHRGISLDVIPLHSTNLLTVLDRNGIIEYESPSIERIYGFDQQDLIGDPVAEYFHPDDRDQVVEAFETVVESEEYLVESVEYRHEQADGSYLWVESVASADPTPSGSYVVNTRDISARKAREQELELSNAKLDEFAHVVSHDLRNPLNVAKGRLALVREDFDSDHFAAIEQAHDRMETLIDDLLALAQIGDRVHDRDAVDLGSLCEACWQTVETLGGDLVVDTDQVVMADRSRLRQLLENLMRNAVVHGGSDVTVTVGPLATETGFYLEDDGQGIDAAIRDQIFERGFSTRADGTGFGLTIVTEIADAHGWDIDLTTSDTGGARFEITGLDSN